MKGLDDSQAGAKLAQVGGRGGGCRTWIKAIMKGLDDS